MLFIVCNEEAVFRHSVFAKLIEQNPSIKTLVEKAVKRELKEDFASLSIKKFILNTGKPHSSAFRISSKVKPQPRITRNSAQ